MFEQPLLNHLTKMMGNTHHAEEILQEVMLLLISKIDHYVERSDLENSFKAWIFRLATNRAIDEIRKTKKHISFNETHESSVTDITVEFKDVQDRINNLINQLPVIQRTILNLKINEQLSLKEIALICKCEVNAVKQSLFRGRRSLKSILVKEGIVL
jgi:RNA polymerase sigma-70 factor (ECF subfamily)